MLQNGNTFKVITLAASIEEKTINLFDDHFYDGGSIIVGNLKIFVFCYFRTYRMKMLIKYVFSSFPVGKVTIKYLYSMDFEEYLIALGEDRLTKEIKTHYVSNEALMNPIHEKVLDLYKKYLVLGGMPALINNFIINDFNISHVKYELQEQIITSYLTDMNKYTENSEGLKIVEYTMLFLKNLLELIIHLNIVLLIKMYTYE